MTPEMGKNNLTPLERVALLFGIAEKGGIDPLHTREYRLGDGMIIDIYRHERLDAYSVLMNPLEPELPRVSFNVFSGGKESYVAIDLPDVVFKVDDIMVGGIKAGSAMPNDEKSSIIAEKLVGWLDQTIRANKYIPCPISVEFKTSK